MNNEAQAAKVMGAFKSMEENYKVLSQSFMGLKKDYEQLYTLICAAINAMPYRTITIPSSKFITLPEEYRLKYVAMPNGDVKLSVMTKYEEGERKGE